MNICEKCVHEFKPVPLENGDLVYIGGIEDRLNPCFFVGVSRFGKMVVVHNQGCGSTESYDGEAPHCSRCAHVYEEKQRYTIYDRHADGLCAEDSLRRYVIRDTQPTRDGSYMAYAELPDGSLTMRVLAALNAYEADR